MVYSPGLAPNEFTFDEEGNLIVGSGDSYGQNARVKRKPEKY